MSDNEGTPTSDGSHSYSSEKEKQISKMGRETRRGETHKARFAPPPVARQGREEAGAKGEMCSVMKLL